MKLVKVLGSELNALSQRVIKSLGWGKNDIQTALELSPFGVDGNPPSGMVALYSPTASNGETVIIGYINKNQLAEVGEVRHYSTDAENVQQFYTWMRNDGTYEIGGTTDNMVRYTALNTALQSQVEKINIELGKIAAGLAGVAGVYTVAPISLNISAAKIEEIKTI